VSESVFKRERARARARGEREEREMEGWRNKGGDMCELADICALAALAGNCEA
jgi:hypothetical protein